MPAIVLSREFLEHAIRCHGGNRTAMHSALGLSPNTIRRLIAHHSLNALADSLAAEDGRPGPRARVGDETLQAERERILESLSIHGTCQKAAEAIVMSPATFYRRLRDYGITRAEAALLPQPSSTNPPEK